MKRKIILRLSYLIVFLTVFWSCHNEDFANGNIEPQRNNANFFLHSTKGEAAARGGVDYVAILEAYNRDKNFLSSMPDQQGMPVWDKMQVLDNGEKTVLYVPLSADRNGLSSLLIVNIDEENAVSRLQNFTNDYLETYVYNADNPTAKRKLLMDTFLQMDFLTFGHQEFTNLPKDIYTGSTDYNRLNIPEVKIEAEQSKGFIYNTICTTFHYCVHGHSTSSCDYGNCTCGGFISCFMVTSCTTTATWIDDSPFPSFPGSHGGGGGGGGGTPGPQPPVDPCVMNTVFYRVKPGCLGSGGDPGIDGLDDPCKKIKKTVNKPQIKDSLASMKNFAQTSKKKERGFQELNNGTTIADQVHNFSVETIISVNTKGLVHVHPLRSIHMFAPMDIITFLDVLRSKNDATIADSYSGMVSASGTYFISFNGTMADLPAAIVNQDDFDKYIQKIVNDYEEAYYELLKNENKMRNGILSPLGKQKLFFEIIKKMGLEGKINLIQEENGVTSPIILDTNNTPQKQPSC